MDIIPSERGYCPAWTRTLRGTEVHIWLPIATAVCQVMEVFAEGTAIVEELHERPR